MTFVVHLLDLGENLPQYVFNVADFKNEQFPGAPPVVFLIIRGSGSSQKHFLNRSCLYTEGAQY